MHIDHLHTGKLFQRRTRRQPGGNTAQSLLEGDLQTVGDEGNKNMRLYPLILLMMYRTDPQIVLQFLEGLLHFGQLHVVLPQLRRIIIGEIRAQQLAALMAPLDTQFGLVERKREAALIDVAVLLRHVNRDERIRSPGIPLGAAQLDEQLIAGECLLL